MEATGQTTRKGSCNRQLIENGMLGDLFIDFYDFTFNENCEEMSEDRADYKKKNDRSRSFNDSWRNDYYLLERRQRRLFRFSIVVMSAMIVMLFVLILLGYLYPLMNFFIDPLINLILKYVL